MVAGEIRYMLARLCTAAMCALHLGSCSGTGPTTPTPAHAG